MIVVSEETIDRFNRSSLSGIYGCLETTNVSVLVEEYAGRDRLLKFAFRLNDLVLDYLKNPCTNVFFYSYDSQKFAEWNEKQSNVFEAGSFDPTRKNTVEIIENLREQDSKDTNSKQILLYMRYILQFDEEISEKLGLLDAEPNWNVILVCHPSRCPLNNLIPIHRIVPMEYPYPYITIRNDIKNLIENPDFNKFELLRHTQLEDKRLKCLAGKNIYVFLSYSASYAIKLFEEIALLLSSTRNMNTKIIMRGNVENFWLLYTKENKISSERFIMTIESRYTIKQMIKDTIRDTTTGIYTIQGGGKDIVCSHYSTSRRHKSAVVYTFGGGEFAQNCTRSFEKISVRNGEIGENWFEDVLSAACFLKD